MSLGSASFNQILLFPFFPVNLPSCQVSLSEATPGAESSTSERQKLEGLPANQGSVLNSQPMLTLPKPRHPKTVDEGHYLMPVAGRASHMAQQFLCRESSWSTSHHIQVLALICAFGGPGTIGASRLPFPHGCDLLLSLRVTPQCALVLSIHAAHLPGLLLSFFPNSH